MTTITHHTPDAMLAAYASGCLPQPYALVVAAHVSLCQACRVAFEAHQSVGGAVLNAFGEKGVTDGLKSRVLLSLTHLLCRYQRISAPAFIPVL